MPAVSVSAARDTAGNLQLALANLDTQREAVVKINLQGASATSATGRVLTAKAMDAHNTPASPEQVAPVKISGRKESGVLVMRLPAKSVSVVRLQ